MLESCKADVPARAAEHEAWSCPVSFAPDSGEDDSWATALLSEMNLLRPWYDRSLRERGRTTVGLSGIELDEIPQFLAQFVETPGNETALDGVGVALADSLKCSAEDLKAFYNEAATAQPGEASAREIENWYWNECVVGRLLRQISRCCRDHPDQRVQVVAGFTLVPGSQRA